MEKHLIMGTAGHIDHGKTTLIEALTGFNCDTHKEEKSRGITINLGFTNLQLSDERSIGVVDVPGHKNFVNTMIAGVSGIDFVMLVIAADSGVMPQTVEHLNILKMLGVKRGFIALTKSDLVDSELIEAAKEEIKELINDSFLKDCPIVAVSSKTKAGFEDLINVLNKEFEFTQERKIGNYFRMFVDRIFQVQGFGTVINGSVLSGHITKKDKLYLLPGAKELRIRRIERHHKEVEEVFSGDRASFNVVGLRHDEFERGMLVADRVLQTTNLVDAELTLFSQLREFNIWTQVVFLAGTYQCNAKIHLINSNKLMHGEKAIVQVHLPKPVALAYKDHFIIRNSSGDITLGGGTIIDAHPNKHKRRPKRLIKELESLSEGDLIVKIIAEVKKRVTPPTLEEICTVLNVKESRIEEINSPILLNEIRFVSTSKAEYLVFNKRFEEWHKRIVSQLSTHHKRFPLDTEGKTIQELLGVLGAEQNQDFLAIFKFLLAEMQTNKEIRKEGNTWVLDTHHIELSDKELQQIDMIESFFKESDMTLPLITKLEPQLKRMNVNDKFFKQVLSLLVKKQRIFKSEEHYLHADIVHKTALVLLKHLNETNEGVKVSDFRDLIDGNRKICLALLFVFERQGWIFRKGDFRFITHEGREYFQKSMNS